MTTTGSETTSQTQADDRRQPVIEVQGLRRTYGEGAAAFEAVRGIDLDVAEGEVLALLGTNGAGKTSTFDVLEGLAAPSAGEVRVFGHDPVRDRRRIRPLTGTMLQSGGLPAELTVAETLEMWRGTVSNPTTVDDVMARVGLTERADVRVAALSGGEQRRVDLASALLGRPRLLFLDEPTTGLDPESRRGTWKLLADLKRSGVTMVLTTHYLDEAEALADRIAIMHHGEIVVRGTLREIVAAEPAVIRFDHPGLALPPFDGASVDAQTRVTIRTDDLQRHLTELLEWAEQRDLQLGGLEARAATLESVFLRIAERGRTPSPGSSATTSVPTGARS